MIQTLRLYCGFNVCYDYSRTTTLLIRPGGSMSPDESRYERVGVSKHSEIVLQSMVDFFFAQGENACYAARAFRNSRPTVIKWTNRNRAHRWRGRTDMGYGLWGRGRLTVGIEARLSHARRCRQPGPASWADAQRGQVRLAGVPRTT